MMTILYKDWLAQKGVPHSPETVKEWNGYISYSGVDFGEWVIINERMSDKEIDRIIAKLEFFKATRMPDETVYSTGNETGVINLHTGKTTPDKKEDSD